MPYAAFLIGLALQSVAQSTPIIDVEGFPSAETEVLEMDADPARRMTLPVMIGTQGPFEFVIDTGSQATVVARELGTHLELPSDGHATVVGVASRERVELVQLDGLQIGRRTLDGLSAAVLEKEHIGADGILGLDSLQDMRVLIDFRDESIAVTETSRRQRSRGYEIIVRAKSRSGRLLITDAEIDNVSVTVIIDTGSQVSIGNPRLAERLRSRKVGMMTGQDVTGATFDASLEHGRRLRMGSMGIENFTIAFADAPIFKELDLEDRPALILGMSELRAFDRVAIDFGSRRILFDLPPRFHGGTIQTLELG